jgi:hypothetical protein
MLHVFQYCGERNIDPAEEEIAQPAAIFMLNKQAQHCLAHEWLILADIEVKGSVPEGIACPWIRFGLLFALVAAMEAL